MKPTLWENPTAEWLEAIDFDCPHCKRQQVGRRLVVETGAIRLLVRQCASCRDLEVVGMLSRSAPRGPGSVPPIKVLALYPATAVRPAKSFRFAAPEVEAAYREACSLYSVHSGASGAYARRALELLLEQVGYKKPTLASSIDMARAEKDPDKKLPARFLVELDYVKEIGNFALHIRRGPELAIVDISSEEVEACLGLIEELITFIYEEPGEAYERAVALNVKLKGAGKKELPLPPLPAALQQSDELQNGASEVEL